MKNKIQKIIIQKKKNRKKKMKSGSDNNNDMNVQIYARVFSPRLLITEIIRWSLVAVLD